jgi:hypothetical protein
VAANFNGVLNSELLQSRVLIKIPRGILQLRHIFNLHLFHVME